MIKINKVSETPEKEYVKTAKKLVLGSKKPTLYTQIISVFTLIIFVGYFVWNQNKLFVFNNIDSLGSKATVTKAKSIVRNLAAESDLDKSTAIETFSFHAFAMSIAAVIGIVGLVLIYRRYQWAYFILYAACLGLIVLPLILTNWTYASTQVGWYEYVLLVGIAVLFHFSRKQLLELKKEKKVLGL